MAILANINRDRKKSRPFSEDDFMPGRAPVNTPERLFNSLRQHNTRAAVLKES